MVYARLVIADGEMTFGWVHMYDLGFVVYSILTVCSSTSLLLYWCVGVTDVSYTHVKGNSRARCT